MPQQKSWADRIHYDGHREYTKKQGNIDYLDGTPLMRPFKMPAVQRTIAIVFIVIGIVIGGMIVNNLVIQRWQDAAHAEQALADNLAREASINTIPNVANQINLDNATILAGFKDAGLTIYETTADENSDELAVWRIPSDITLSEAQQYFKQGISSLNAIEASKLLNGAWYFSADRANGTSMVVRYADFSTGDPQIAVQNAIKNQGFDGTTINNTGVDDSGNTFSSGTVDANGTTCTFKVSALPLDDMYSVSGLPEDACYVGIRVTTQ